MSPSPPASPTLSSRAVALAFLWRRRAAVLALSSVAIALLLGVHLLRGASRETTDPSGAPIPSGPVVARYPGGVITRGELEYELRSLPRGTREGVQEYFIEAAAMLAWRKGLAEYARREGLGPAATGELAERAQVRALLAREGLRKPRGWEEAEAHFERYLVLRRRAVPDKVEIVKEGLAGLAIDTGEPNDPPPAPPRVATAEPYFMHDTQNGGRCSGVVYPQGTWSSATSSGSRSST